MSRPAVHEVSEHEEEEDPIHRDILLPVFSFVPLIDLVGASYVSKSWNHGVYSSLHSFNRTKPWLILHSQSTRPPYTISTHGYDPRSHVWIEISKPPPIEYVSSLMSSHDSTTFLYMLSLSQLSFSYDPLNLEWHQVDAPSVVRVDPVVAKVGDSIVVAGGTCEFEHNRLAVEVFSITNKTWGICESMPYGLKHSAASTWLSTASISKNNKLFVMEKSTAVLHSFNVETGHWSGPHDFRPADQRCFNSMIASVGDRLIVILLIGDIEKVDKVKMFELVLEDFSCRDITEMPSELIEKLRCESFEFSSIEICSGKGIVFMYNRVKMEEVVMCEFLKSGGYSWGSVRNTVVAGGGDGGIMRLSFTCGEISVQELQRAIK